jgi:thiamine pyrophosphate-dependent acetolactate synthase large subunit-like protein
VILAEKCEAAKGSEPLATEVKRTVRGGTALVKSLEANGVRTVFGIPGVHTLDAYDALIDSDYVDTILPRHEQGAGFMADGYYRASGKPGVALIVTGPGVTNVATAVGEAYADSSKVLIIATNLEREYLDSLEGNLHEIRDQMGIMEPITKWSKRVMSAQEIPGSIAEALHQLDVGRPRPVYLEIPLDVLAEECEIEDLPVAQPHIDEPDPAQVNAAAEKIRAGGKLLVFAGGGTVSEEASEALTEFAELTGAVVFTSLMGKGSIAEDHPRALGSFGYRWSADSPIVPFMAGSDTCLAIGTGLGLRTTASGTMPLPNSLIHVDLDANEFNKRYQADVAIQANAAATLRALIDNIKQFGGPKDQWTVEEIASGRDANFAPADERAARYVPYLHALRTAIPRDGVVVNDMTMMSYEAARYFPVYEPHTYTFPRGFGTLGSSLPTAIGAKVARPDRQVVSINGDGGVQFTLTELGAAVHHKIPVAFVIFNDSTHTAVKAAQQRTYPGRFIDVDLVNPDYVKIAEAYGIQGMRAESPEQLTSMLKDAMRGNEPVIIDVPINLERY